MLSKQTTKLTGLNKYQKGDFTSSPIAVYRKSIFNYLNPFKNISGYLNLWRIFRFVFGQLRMSFCHKITVAKNNFIFTSNAQHNFAKKKIISKCKNDKPFDNKLYRKRVRLRP